MDLAQGHLCYVEYQGYPGVVHARLVIEQVSGTEWVIATPDNDVYVEDLQPQNPDFSQFFHVPNGGLPPGVLELTSILFSLFQLSSTLVC